ncbi:MAG: hypothetical protein IJQ80_04485 [Clostridia bacterium]|nr:hypothetical protein [Clostridia bacterium]
MHIADNDFFEAYKRLDKLCSEMYSCQNGVSEYIAQMEHLTYKGQYRISSWNNDYKQLKHVRWVRNQIAHDADSYQISEAGDMAFVQEFYSRIFSGSDPLTLLRKAVESKNRIQSQQKKQQKAQVHVPDEPYAYTPNKKKSRAWIGILIGVGMIALILLILYYHQ